MGRERWMGFGTQRSLQPHGGGSTGSRPNRAMAASHGEPDTSVSRESRSSHTASPASISACRVRHSGQAQPSSVRRAQEKPLSAHTWVSSNHTADGVAPSAQYPMGAGVGRAATCWFRYSRSNPPGRSLWGQLAAVRRAHSCSPAAARSCLASRAASCAARCCGVGSNPSGRATRTESGSTRAPGDRSRMRAFATSPARLGGSIEAAVTSSRWTTGTTGNPRSSQTDSRETTQPSRMNRSKTPSVLTPSPPSRSPRE